MNDTKIIVHAYDWIIRDKGGDDDSTTIECWSLDQNSNPYLLRITDFPVFCYIELPLIVKGRPFNWTAYEAFELMELINRRLGERKSTKREYRQCQKLYYYQGNATFPFIRAYFNNIPDMKNCKYKLDNPLETDRWGWIQCQVHEENISVVRKLLTYKQIRFSSWFQVMGTKVDDELKISSLDNEYIIKWNTMMSVPEDICKEWITNPGILSWDIETYSDNHLAMPDKYNDAHVAYMVSAIYKKYKIEGTYQRYAIIIGDCNEIDPAKLENCVLIKVNDEIELVQAFADVINLTNPEILIGYNILGYDYPYLNHRIIRQLENWPVMSRIVGEISKMSANNWKSKAYGNNSMSTLNISGRISIDLLPVIKRDNKFESYTLNYVCEHFLNKKKYDVTAPQMFTYYEQIKDAVANYKNKPSQETYDALEFAKIKTTEVMEYCIRDSELCIDLMENQDVWVGMIELSNIVGVTIVEIFTKGQQVRCVSQLYDLACQKNVILNCREAPNYTFKGGSVQKPIPGLYDNVICLDFKSLYPSIIEALNICYTTLVAPEHDKTVPDDQCHVVEFDQDIDYSKVKKLKQDVEIDLDDSSSSEDELEEKVEEELPTKVHYKIKFYKHKQGLVPLLVKNLVSERNAVRSQQKHEKNPQVKMVLEKRQLALKVSANSFFGFFGVQEGGKLPCLEAAMAITAKGRELIATVGKYLNDKYEAKIVYGDSVTGNTPILCQIGDKIKYMTIEQIGDQNKWDIYGDKQASSCDNINVWTEKGWTKLNRVIRHYTTKPIYRILTNTGCVDVTSDHSLINPKGEKVTPMQVNIGSELLHADLPIRANKTEYLIETEAYLLGYKWACDNVKNQTPLPAIIYNEPNTIKEAFLKGYYSNITHKATNKIEIAELYYLSFEIGKHLHLYDINNQLKFINVFNDIDVNNNEIIQMIYMNSTLQYVYDLETENHHFSAGIGRLIVHNTDSVMVDMNIKDSKECNYWGELLAQEISGVKKGSLLPGKDDEYHTEDKAGLFLSPLAMEFEKAMRLYCIKPKMYAAYYVGKDGEFKKKTLKDSNGKIIKVLDELEMLTRGIPLVRRDKNKFLQFLYRKILDIIMMRGSFKDACSILIDNINDFMNNKIDYNLLKSTRELGSHYKQPSFYMKVFADELRKKNKIVNPGDRLEFLIVENSSATLVGQKMILTSDYLESLQTDHPFQIDYMHYIEKVIMNPLDNQLFSIGFADHIVKLNHIQYTPGRKRIPLTLKNITEMIFYMLKNKINIMIFKKRLLQQIDAIDKNNNFKFNIIQ
jgi:DNA polymerase elongation subunit (family B)